MPPPTLPIKISHILLLSLSLSLFSVFLLLPFSLFLYFSLSISFSIFFPLLRIYGRFCSCLILNSWFLKNNSLVFIREKAHLIQNKQRSDICLFVVLCILQIAHPFQNKIYAIIRWYHLWETLNFFSQKVVLFCYDNCLHLCLKLFWKIKATIKTRTKTPIDGQ